MQSRINKELQELSTNPPENCAVSLVGDDITHWRVNLVGPEGSAYEGGNFELALTVPANYPFRAPDVRFVTRIYHPNVKSDDGAICTELYQSDWSPTKNIRHVIELLLSTLITPSPEHAVEPEIAQQMMNSHEAYVATARQWVNQYAR
ncbi:unnamed protein product [Blepharisma stoltei]|uniref:E2 ubiquitin-conjugating enzyme n=1 Tax=Blepharisma stoltei TaxID=1481888 RepID=A0AAU9IH24_9CILI|nr:unnamed protein product [Blepharisma stoltei]